MGRGQPGILRTPPAQQASILHDVNPNTIFQDLVEIGHGSFGSVYQATKEGQTVAIKIMKVPNGFDSDTWNDIYREIEFMSSIEHEHIIGYFGGYLDDLSVWLTMEYAIGSAQDVMDVFKAPFKEVEIAAVTVCCLQALTYLHEDNKIHRDIKAGNILLSEKGVIKLADFGSASTKTPANSLIGTPYWMAPELIMAMETGTYGCSVDIWSLGITAIELAQRKPPLFELNAMTALYHIPQKDAPTLQEPDKWSSSFVTFVSSCLEKDPSTRQTAAQLLKHPYIAAERPPGILEKIVERTKSPELQQENAAALEQVIKSAEEFVAPINASNAMSRPSGGDSAAESSTDDLDMSSKPGPNPELEPETSLVIGSTVVKDIPAPKSSTAAKSIAIKVPNLPESEKEGATPIPSSPKVDTRKKSLPAILEPEAETSKGGTSLQVARATRWQNERSDPKNQAVVIQLKEIRKMREEMSKQLEALNVKLDAERTKSASKASHEHDRLVKKKEKDLEKHATRCKAELETYLKQEASELKRHLKSRKDITEKAWVIFKKSCDTEYRRAKATMSLDSVDKSRQSRKTMKDDIKDQHAASKKLNEDKLRLKLEEDTEVARIEFDLSRLPLLHAFKFRHLKEEVELIIQANNDVLTWKEQALTTSNDMVRGHLREQSNMQELHLAKLVETEQRQAMKIQRDAVKSMKKRHLNELKMQPKELKDGEKKMKRMFTDSLRLTEKKYNSTAKKLSLSIPKEEQETALSKHSAQKSIRLSQLEVEYHRKLTEMKEGATSATTKSHLQDQQDLEERNVIESTALKNYQLSREKKQKLAMKKRYKLAEQKEVANMEELKQLREKILSSNDAQRKRLTTLQQKQSNELMKLQEALSTKRATTS